MKDLTAKALDSLSKEQIKDVIDKVSRSWLEGVRSSIALEKKAREEAFGKHYNHDYLDILAVVHMIEDMDGDDDTYAELVYWILEKKKLEDFKIALKKFESLMEKK